jgi:hypothetical protein
MKTFQKTASQGEIDMCKLGGLPPGLKKIEPDNGRYIIGHSETGHHHVIDASRVEAIYEGTTPEGMKALYAILKDGAALEHLRDFNTHEAVGFNAGDIVEFVSGEELDPYAEARRAQAD